MLTQKEILEMDIKLRKYLGKVLEDVEGFSEDDIDEIAYTISELVLDIVEGIEDEE